MKFRCILYTQNGYIENTALPMGWTCAHAFQWVGCAPKDEWDHLSALGYYPPVAFPGCVCGGRSGQGQSTHLNMLRKIGKVRYHSTATYIQVFSSR